MRNTRGGIGAVLLCAAFTLSACESAEDRADRHYQAGLALVEEGDIDRAIVSLRNVFRHEGTHKEARALLAALLIERGQIEQGYGQLLRLVEQEPEDAQARITLAEIALSRSDWNEAERHGRAVLALLPDLPAVIAVNAALDYRVAVLDENDDGMAAAADAARKALAADPATAIASRVVIDFLLSGPEPQDAMPIIEAAIELEPLSLDFHVLKLRLLGLLQDMPAVGAQLRVMSQAFPQNAEVTRSLINWYLQQDDLAGAETYLREIAAAASPAPEGNITVVQFLQATQGIAAAQEELARLTALEAEAENHNLYRAYSASLDFDDGRTEEAIAALEDVVRGAAPSDSTRDTKSILANMLSATGNAVGARALVEDILAEDPSHVEALKLRASFFIAADNPRDAILALRTALDQSARDPSIVTLMATAHERDGATELAAESLALAVEFSGSGVAESLRYVQFLMQSGRTEVSDTVLTDALRVNPSNIDLLAALAEVRLIAADWPRVQEVIAGLRQIDSPEAKATADTAQARLLIGQNRNEETVAFLQDLVARGEGDVVAVAVVLRTLVAQDKLGDARSYLEARLELAPDNRDLLLLSASLHTLEGNIESALDGYAALIADQPGAEQPVAAMYQLLRRENRLQEATEVLDAALTAERPALRLRWFKASELEAAGEFEAAIAIYDAAYAEDATNLVIANNLASMITTYRTDEESLMRAQAIARRLRDVQVPAFQDTYGWIEYRLGNYQTALQHLEFAAEGLPDEAMIQFHLGMTYAALERIDDAQRVLRRALDLAGDSTLPQFDVARETLASIPIGQ